MIEIHPELFRKLFEQALLLTAYIEDHWHLIEERDDDRSPDERACDYVAQRAGYRTDNGEANEVAQRLWCSVRNHNRQSGAPSRVDQAPEYTP